MQSGNLAGVLLAVFAACACDRTPPRSIKFELPELIVGMTPVNAVLMVRDQSGLQKKATGSHDFRLDPADLASVAPNGTIRCKRSGNARLTVAIRGVEASHPVRCRLIGELVVERDVERLVLGQPAQPIGVKVLNEKGQPAPDVPLTLSAGSSRALHLKGRFMLPNQVGSATVSVQAGEEQASFRVEVVEKLQPEAIALEGGRKAYFSLPPGKYELTARFQSNAVFSATWRGAPYCNYQGSAEVHRTSCVLRTKGGVEFDNPGYIVNKSKELALQGVALYAVP
jgi:hypothetical protein